MESLQASLRSLIEEFHDLQTLRIQLGDRLVAYFKIKLGQKPNEKEETPSAEAGALLKNLRILYRKMTYGIHPLTSKTFKRSGIISSFSEYAMVQMYIQLRREEVRERKVIKDVVKISNAYQRTRTIKILI